MITSQAGAISGAALSYLNNIDVADVPYVIFQGDSYRTYLFYGDGVSCYGSSIVGTADYVLYDQRGYSVYNGSGGYIYYPTISYGTDELSVDTSTCLYFTNVFTYAPRQEGGVVNAKIGAVGLAVSALFVLAVMWSVCKHAIFRLPSRLR